ncbi:MAG: GrpB family protein [Patescibacteria group bacterium]
MNERIKIVEPSIEISELQKEVIAELSRMLPNSSIESIGSMAVPISGKLEIDIMIVSDDVQADSQVLSKQGYKQGPFLKEISYLSAKRSSVRVDIQILSTGHKMIEIHRKTLRKLRDDAVLSKAYEQFKKSLNGLPKNEYKKKKVEWIKKNLISD